MKLSLLGATACALILAAAPTFAQNIPAWDDKDGTNRVKGIPAVVSGGPQTTPAGTGAYASGNLIANSATAGSVTPFTFTGACSVSGGAGAIQAARLKTTDTGFAGKIVALKLHRTAPTYTNGDHAAWLTTESDYIGSITVTLSEHFSDFEKGIGTPDLGATVNGRNLIVFDCAAGSTAIYGELVAGGAITPQGAKAITPVLEVLH